jgi:hypothetical protein
MSNDPTTYSVHTKKYYRVVLEDFNRDTESLEGFAIKLSMRTRTTLPRVRQVLRNLPYVIKSGLSSEQANLLKSILERSGGRVRVESHFVTPGAHSTAEQPEPGQETTTENSTICPECGWAVESDSNHCSFCHGKIRGTTKRPETPANRRPDVNPLGAGEDRSIELGRPQPKPVGLGVDGPMDLARAWAKYRLTVAIGLLIVVLVILILK